MTVRFPIATALTLALALALGSPAAAQVGAQTDAFVPVTDAMLHAPDPADWLSWRRTLDGQGHSPLDQITTDNVDRLRLAWSWSLEPGSQQTTPLVYDGVLYIANPGEVVQALDAATGNFLWEYRRDAPEPGRSFGGPPPGRAHRNIAIYGDMVYLNTADAHIVAIDARTGEERWDADLGGGVGFQFSSGSIVADGMVVAGLTGCGRYRDDTCYIVGIDARTGEERWRTSTIALPGETLDMDEVFERILIDYGGRRSVFTMGKMAVLWELDLETGAFRNAHDLGYQTFADVDPETGAVTYREGMIPTLYEEIFWCPSTAGFKSWRAMSYHPGLETFFIPINLNCETGIFGPVDRVEGGGGAGPVRRTNHFHPDSPGQLGEFLAMDMRTGDVRWRRRFETPINSAALTTDGGLAFAGSWDRYIYAFDADDGETLWQTRLPTSIQGFPISYAVDGTQYIAVPVGTGGASWGGLIPADLLPHRKRPGGGNGLFVFALDQ